MARTSEAGAADGGVTTYERGAGKLAQPPGVLVESIRVGSESTTAGQAWSGAASGGTGEG